MGTHRTPVVHRRSAAPLLTCLAAGLGVSLVAGCGGSQNTGPSQLPSIRQGMVLVHAGTFAMGSPLSEPGRQSDESLHLVQLTHPFWILGHEVTQAEWQQVMGGNPSFFRSPDFPAENVSWLDAVAFCNALSLSESLKPVYTVVSRDSVAWDQTASGYRLPTEAEWERACRAGSSSAFSDGPILHAGKDCYSDANLDAVGWYCGNFANSTHSVETKAPNSWGLYDMHGNVWEWCWDRYATYDSTSAIVVDPIGPYKTVADTMRVLRGGSWGSEARFCRAAARWNRVPSQADNSAGFRVARTAPDSLNAPSRAAGAR